jgi:hypothetical protein
MGEAEASPCWTKAADGRFLRPGGRSWRSRPMTSPTIPPNRAIPAVHNKSPPSHRPSLVLIVELKMVQVEAEYNADPAPFRGSMPVQNSERDVISD